MKILVYTSPARGHLFPITPTILELAARGHEVSVRTLASEADLLSEQGIDMKPIDARIEALEHHDYLAKSPPAKLKRGLGTFVDRAPIEIEDLDAAIAAEQPELLLIDAMCWGAAAAAEVWGGPWAQWFPYPMPLGSRDVPPFGPGLKPAEGPFGRARDRLLRPILTRQFTNAFLPGLNEVRSAAGAREFNSADELFTSPPLTLYMTAEPFEYARSDWPDQIQSIGPCPWDPPADAPEWLDEIDRPLVLVSTSSEFQDDGKLVEIALEALKDEDVFVVATLPASSTPVQVPANACVERFVPHAPILQRAACAVTHGGAGATQKALAAGVPVCTVPFGRDQFEVARRVEQSGGGTRLPSNRLNAARLRESVRAARSMKEGAERVARGFASAGGATRAADLVEALAVPSLGSHEIPRAGFEPA
jgi:MGT family glycosyltransferase